MRDKKIEMLKEGQYVPWDGSDVNSIIVTETITLEEMKKRFPTALAKICKGAWCCQRGVASMVLAVLSIPQRGVTYISIQ